MFGSFIGAMVATKWKILLGVGGASTSLNVLAQVVDPTGGYLLEGGLAIAIALSFFSIVGALVTDKIVSSSASERIAREAAVTAVREFIRQQKEGSNG